MTARRASCSVRPEEAAKSRAVLLGVHTYQHLGALTGVRHNVPTLRNLLTAEDVGGLPDANCVSVPDDSGPNDFLDALNDAALEANHMLLVYYAGHGQIGGKDGRSLLLTTVKSRPGRPYHSALYENIDEVVAASRARHRIVILDCCFSGLAVRMGDELPSSEVEKVNFGIQGACVLTSAAGTERALCEADGSVFTRELTSILQDGLQGELHDGRRGESQAELTMGDIFSTLQIRLRGRVVEGYPVPQPRSFFEEHGHLIPIARNRAFTGNPPQRKWEDRRKGEKEQVRMVSIDAPRLRRKSGIRGLFGIRAEDSEEFQKVYSAHFKVMGEFESACADHKVGNKSIERRSNDLARKTEDGRWLVVGDNVAALAAAAERIYPGGLPGGGMYSGGSQSAVLPSPETATAYVVAAAKVMEQLKTLRGGRHPARPPRS
ncbi:caspase family protein [Streptomyces sp. NBC_00568]|uniref:caspase family protein n=1 Tax=Streptomyces sp. NBC_00568 TaxID=2975779 RepID=UPI0022588150|nr:caspase family protein [Streptomyces sp. NBC_00568]MCX4993554.1 caspase family protein [Streptomyces sp. NBC_00568]